MKNVVAALLLTLALVANSQSIDYDISFGKAVDHIADITVTFSDIEKKPLDLRLSRTSPGRYALHEFAKNVFDVRAVDQDGNSLDVTRINPYEWQVKEHNGFAKVSYQLFANRGDGTYAQVDETHAHLNAPATFMYSPSYEESPININFDVRDDLNWKVATQLKPEGGTRFSAPNLQYFMDSPVEISDYKLREFTINSNGMDYNIRFVLHGRATNAELDQYFDQVKKVVEQQKEVFGEVPDFDYGTYTFLACYIPNASGDGMEHRNSTILTSTRALDEGGMSRNIGTVSHEFFHAWNVERIRPQSLEPFNFQDANMTGALWFAEGFTSYYTRLILCRAGIITPENYISGLSGALNYVWNSPARKYKNPIDMSNLATFVDAARSVDPVNRENTFISYYSYGSVLGLALDLALRQEEGDLSMDGYMKLAWERYGKPEKPYTIAQMRDLLAEYAGDDFGKNWFDQYIYQSKMPDYESLMAGLGASFEQQNLSDPYLGVYSRKVDEGYKLSSNPYEGMAAQKASLSSNDIITKINDQSLEEIEDLGAFLKENYAPGDIVDIEFLRFEETKTTKLTFDKNPSYTTSINADAKKKSVKKRNDWLKQND